MEAIPRRETLSRKWPAVYRDRPRDSQSKDDGAAIEK